MNNNFHFTIVYDQQKESGNGHKSRCDALHQAALNADFQCNSASIESDLDNLLENSDCLIVDSYSPALLQKALRKAKLRGLFTAAVECPDSTNIAPDINLNIGLKSPCLSKTVVSGLHLACIRNEILSQPKRPKAERDIDLLVSFGATDPKQNTEAFLQTAATLKIPPNNILCVLPRRLESAPTKTPINTTKDFERFPELLSRAERVLCNAGVTALEANFLGICPVIVPSNEREAYFANILVAERVAHASLNSAAIDTSTAKIVFETRDIQTSVIDGRGPSRIINEIIKAFSNDR